MFNASPTIVVAVKNSILFLLICFTFLSFSATKTKAQSHPSPPTTSHSATSNSSTSHSATSTPEAAADYPDASQQWLAQLDLDEKEEPESDLDEDDDQDDKKAIKFKKKDRKKIKKAMEEIAEILDRLSLDVELKFAFRYAKNRARAKDDRGGFELSGVTFDLDYKLKKGVKVYLQYEVDPLESELEDAYVRFKDNDAWVDRTWIGLKKRFWSLPSELQTPSLNDIALYRLRDNGITLRTSFLDHFRAYFALSNGGRLDTRDISPRRVAKQDVILADTFDERQAFGTNSRELSAGFSAKYKNDGMDLQRAEFLLFYVGAPLSDDDTPDLETLSDVPGFTGIAKEGVDTNSRNGVNLLLEFENLLWRTQFVRAIVRDLDRDLATTELSYTLGDYELIAGWSQQTLSVDPDPLYPVSWERRRTTLGLNYDWFKKSDLVFEYTSNQEDTGGEEVDNDEFLLAWIFKF